MCGALSKARDISSLLYNSPLSTYYPSISTHAQINFTNSENTGRMPVVITPVTKKVPGMDFPINHETYPNDCENVACAKVEGRYRPGSWVVITNEWDDSEHEFTEFENFVCTECNERNKKSLNGSRIQRRYEAEPVLKEKEPTRTAMATSKPLAWVKRTPKLVETKPVEEKKVESKPLIKAPMVVHTAAGKLIRISAPKKLLPKNDRNAADPRLGSLAQIKMAKDKALPLTPLAEKKPMIAIPREPGMTPYEQYRRDQKAVNKQKKLKEEQRKKEEEQVRLQNECWDELRKARCKEYISFQNMIVILKEIHAEPLRWIVINAYIQHHQFDTKRAHMALKHCSGVLSAKERNRLQHALNGNIDIPAATFTTAILAGITYLMWRNQTTVVEPRYNPAGEIVGAIQVCNCKSVGSRTNRRKHPSRSCSPNRGNCISRNSKHTKK